MRTIQLLLLLVCGLHSAGEIRVLDLRGHWLFKIGDDMAWKEADFDDSGWEKIFVPSAWEDEGFYGYDGYAWYRRELVLPASESKKNLYLNLGFIDDVDEVYLNGHFIGFSGTFPPDYYTAYNLERRYQLPEKYLRTDAPNILAVRVYDHELGGGILRGKIGIYEDTRTIAMEIDLEGFWKFKTGDNMAFIEPDYPDKDWNTIFVPAPWEIQGYKGYDGIGWYRKEFIIPASLKEERLILLLGMIDDFDETYLNGKWIGGTGKIGTGRGDIHVGGEWREFRAYRVDEDVLNFGRPNLLAVRVYDRYVTGGIYQGPVGIVTYEEYRTWLDTARKGKKNLLERLFNF